MVEDVVGDIILVTMVGKIEKLNDDYGYLKKRFNPTGRVDLFSFFAFFRFLHHDATHDMLAPH
jgi:hypothetical protein